MRTIVFVCSGNTCRSPMAEAIARHVAEQGDLGDRSQLLFVSAGAYALDGTPPTTEALRALQSLGIDHDGISKPLTAEMVRKASFVLGMTQNHVESARMMVGDDAEVSAKIQLLDPAGDVHDPMGQGQDAYDALADRFLNLLPGRLKEILASEHRDRIGSSRS